MQETQDAASATEFLAFTMGQEEYGLDITKVQEIRGYEAVTRLANAPDYFKGVINLRGVIVPVIDMRIKLGMGTPTYDQFTIVIVLHIRDNVMGMVVDSVSDVTLLGKDQVKPAPRLGGQTDIDYLIGMGTIDDRMLVLIDIDKLISAADIGMIKKVSV